MSTNNTKKLSTATIDVVNATDESLAQAEVTSSSIETMKKYAYKPEMWGFIIVAIIILIICTVIAVQNKDWYNALNLNPAASGGWAIFWLVIFWIFTIIFAYFSYLAYAITENMTTKIAVMILFMLVMIATIIWFSILFYTRDLTTAYYFSFALFFLTLALVIICFLVSQITGWVLLELILMAIFVGFSWNILNLNSNQSS